MRRKAFTFAVLLAVLVASEPASAYVGDSYLKIKGHAGSSKAAGRRDWIRIEAHDWIGRPRRVTSGPARGTTSGDNSGFLDRLWFSGPNVPKPGSGGGKVAIVLAKTNPDLPFLMQSCAEKAVLPEADYAESSDRARAALELGPRPAKLPAFWEYRLKNLHFVDCPVVTGAADQALVLAYDDITWLNYAPNGEGTTRIPASLKDVLRVRPSETGRPGSTQAFVVTWMAPSTDTADADCPVLSSKPSDQDIFRFMTPDQQSAYRRKQAELNAASPYGPLTEARGPGGLNVVLLPGIVADPGDPEPKPLAAPSVFPNRLVKVMGCIPGYRGRRGYRNVTLNRGRTEGQIVMLVEISGIDNPVNDENVSVALIYSDDRPVLAAGKVLPNFTYRAAINPNFALFNLRVHARIREGVIITDRIPAFHANLGQHAELVLDEATMRFEIQPDGSLKGKVGGYLDWRSWMNAGSGYLEGLLGYQHPGLYYAMRRSADAMFNSDTQEFDGISAIYELDGVPAFLTQLAPNAFMSQKNPSIAKSLPNAR